MRAWYSPLGLPVAILLIAVATPAFGQEPRFPVISRTEQAARDDQRIDILRVELASETQAQLRAAQRRAERVVARDTEGIKEAEEALAAHRRNINDLNKELDQTRRGKPSHPARGWRASGAPGAVSVPRDRETRWTGQCADGQRTATLRQMSPWWDVYAGQPSDAMRSALGDPSAPVVPAPAAFADPPPSIYQQSVK
jgi:hypothetical protein